MKEFLKIAGALLLGMITGWLIWGSGGDGVLYSVTEIRRDTVRISEPESGREKALGSREVLLARAGGARHGAISGTASRGLAALDTEGSIGADKEAEENADDEAEDEAEGDSVRVEIPIRQREYSGEDYRAWVSGYDARLDSIRIYGKREVVTAVRPDRKEERKKRWAIGPSVGYGYTAGGWQGYVGISLTYTLISF